VLGAGEVGSSPRPMGRPAAWQPAVRCQAEPIPRRWRIFTAVALLALAADLGTKLWARHALPVDLAASTFSLIRGAVWTGVVLALVAAGALAVIVWLVAGRVTKIACLPRRWGWWRAGCSVT
jgi:hypothetical protein